MATVNISHHSQRKYDFVILGATGFTGQYTIEEMIRTAETHTNKFTWAVAGRNEMKLKESIANAFRAVGKEQEDIPMIIADVSDTKSLSDMCQTSKVILNCVGPYRFYGESVVKACVENKTHHIDICGEPQFLEKIQLDYHELAKNAGVFVLGSCGFDSIPCEMGLYLLRQNFPGDIVYVDVYLSGSTDIHANTGTWVSAIHGFAHAKELGQLRAKLLPEKLPRSKFVAPKKNFFYSDVVDGWCLPLPAADKPVALRTMYHEYIEHKARPFQMNLYIRINTLLGALKTIFAGLVFGLFASFQFGRTLLEKYPELFSFGVFRKNGPTRQEIENSWFVTTFVGIGHEDKLENSNEEHKFPPNRKIYIKIKGPEPGYISTPICMIQAGLVLLEEIDKISGNDGGVYTPGIAFANTTLIDRLKKKGIDFICGTPLKLD